MSGHGRGGSDQPRSGGSNNRRQTSSQARRQQAPSSGYPSLPPDSPPVYSPLYPSSNAHTPPNVFPYPPSFHVQEQPQSIHAGYPTIASYSQYPPDTPQYTSPQSQQGTSNLQQPSPVFPQSFSYPSQGYPAYQQQSPSFSPPPAMYQHQHQQHQHQVYPGGSYPQYHSPGAQVQEGEGGGTWWYVPSQPARHTPQYEAGPSTYQFYPQAHAQQPQLDGGADYSSRPGLVRPSTPSSSGAPASPVHPGRGDRPMVRRAYHPNPPAHRSDWVMWAGNVPSDAEHDELWRFFTQPPPDDSDSTASSSSSSSSGGLVDGNVDGVGGDRHPNGVLSIFLISRSSCAFVNYETEAHLQAAIGRFNGVPLRAADPRCARLVCRVRRKDDDLRAGVGGQRGIGMHTRWVKAKQRASGARAGDDSGSLTSASEPGTPSSDSHRSLEPGMSALSIGHLAGSSSSGSHASTDSSLLRQHFPQRYFILKSLTREDLDTSVQKGLWATQKHNEGILERAFRTSKDVFLVFSVNKSGEFYGMSGAPGQIEGHVKWARRDSAASSASGSGRGVGGGGPVKSLPLGALHPSILSGDRHVDLSPQPFPSPTSTPVRPPDVQSAPAVLGKPHRNISSSPAAVKGMSLDNAVAISQRRDIELDESAPIRARRSPPSAGEVAAIGEASARAHERRESMGSAAPGLGSVAEESGEKDEVQPFADGGAPLQDGVGGTGAREDGWGQDFKLQSATRGTTIREVKVSRDGTELEPSVGQALLDEWQLFLSTEGAGGAEAADADERCGFGGGGALIARRGRNRFTIMIYEENRFKNIQKYR
ncbi:hypothetical protein B0H14DRAFT_3435427 [Mycena olivaceomarginata]|nr:hypothetical protein B0H14DRAFT_3435427 [Mycena olivaceomarginata]